MLKKFFEVLFFVLGLLLALYGLCGLIPRPQNYTQTNPVRTDTTLPILIAHGGGNKEFPDNTLEAFYNAYSVDSRVIMETDVSITRDNVLILSHDITLDRKTNVTGYISDWNYADLISQKVDFSYTNPTDDNQQLTGQREHFKTDSGQRVYPTDVEYPAGVTARDSKVFLATTLEELLVAFPNNRINVEIKQSGELGMKALQEALRLIRKYDAFDRVVLASFHEEIYSEFKRLKTSGEVPTSFMFSPAESAVTKFYVTQLFNVDFLFTDQICVLQLPTAQYGLSLSTYHFIKAAHSHNIAVHYWTIDDVAEMCRLIDLGCDGIETNYPHRLKEVLETYNF
jgi:glycerophosphoryl diester phosphodiesterase